MVIQLLGLLLSHHSGCFCDITLIFLVLLPIRERIEELLVFSVKPFKKDQSENKNRKTSRQESGHGNFSKARYVETFFTPIYRDLYGDAMLVPIHAAAAASRKSLEIQA